MSSLIRLAPTPFRRRTHTTAARASSFIGVRASSALVAALCLLAAPAPAFAQPNPDTQAWFQAIALGQLSDTWRTHIEVQPRWFGDASELGLTMVRTAVGYQARPRVSLWVGHAWVPRTFGPGVRHEQRIWQQATLTGPRPAGWATTGRIRLEQRWLEPWDGTSHRLRLLGRAQRPVHAGSPWSTFAYDELMVTLDDTDLGPQSGYDRNRFSAGINRRVSGVASVDLGYIWENGTAGGSSRRNDHVAIGVLNLALPRR